MDNQDLAERLKKLREANGYSLRDLAERIGSSANTIMRWERNESAPSQEFVVKLAELYGRDPVWVTFGVKKPSANQNEDKTIGKISSRLELLTQTQLRAVDDVVALFLRIDVEDDESNEKQRA
jgi:transcriptional regulator with XRE-family HTH domain